MQPAKKKSEKHYKCDSFNVEPFCTFSKEQGILHKIFVKPLCLMKRQSQNAQQQAHVKKSCVYLKTVTEFTATGSVEKILF